MHNEGSIGFQSSEDEDHGSEILNEDDHFAAGFATISADQFLQLFSHLHFPGVGRQLATSHEGLIEHLETVGELSSAQVKEAFQANSNGEMNCTV